LYRNPLRVLMWERVNSIWQLSQQKSNKKQGI
jgi:hypothetical protein